LAASTVSALQFAVGKGAAVAGPHAHHKAREMMDERVFMFHPERSRQRSVDVFELSG